MLHNLVSAGKDRKRVGRGGARGGTSGRGHKGQKGRSGPGLRVSFEGGQMPLTRRIPKRGFNNAAFSTKTHIVSLDRIQEKFSNEVEITLEMLQQSGMVTIRHAERVKLLAGTQPVEKPLVVHAHAASASVERALQAAGGRVILIVEK